MRFMYETTGAANQDDNDQMIICPGMYIKVKDTDEIILMNQETITKLRQGKLKSFPLPDN